jgi:hypothetical protein
MSQQVFFLQSGAGRKHHLVSKSDINRDFDSTSLRNNSNCSQRERHYPKRRSYASLPRTNQGLREPTRRSISPAPSCKGACARGFDAVWVLGIDGVNQAVVSGLHLEASKIDLVVCLPDSLLVATVDNSRQQIMMNNELSDFYELYGRPW